MPDRYGEATDLDTWPNVPPPQGIAASEWTAQQRAVAIVNCELCDDEGRRAGGAIICDHIDHYAESQHGRALVQDELAKINERKAKA